MFQQMYEKSVGSYFEENYYYQRYTIEWCHAHHVEHFIDYTYSLQKAI